MGTAYDNFMAQRHRDKQQHAEHAARVKLVAITCSLGGLAVGGLTGFGITYGVMKNKEKKQEQKPQTEAVVIAEQAKIKSDFNLSFSSSVGEKFSIDDYFENEMSL